MKKLLFLVIGFLLLSFGSAFALPFPMWNSGTNQPGTEFEDQNLDFFLDLVGNNGLIDEGDVLVSAIEFQGVNQVTDVFTNPPTLGATHNTQQQFDDLVAVAIIQVDKIVQTPVGPKWFMKEYDQAGTIHSDFANNEMVRFYTGLGDENFDWNINPTMDTALSQIIAGADFLWSFTVDPTLDEDTYWAFSPVALSAASPAAVRLDAAGTTIGTLDYALTQVDGEDIFDAIELVGSSALLSSLYDGITDDGFVDMTGNGLIKGGLGLGPTVPPEDPDNPYAFARSDIDTYVNPTSPIPEPATMSLFGFGLLGLAAISRRRQ